jgi:hypothetical protein
MTDKTHYLSLLRDEFDRWETLLHSLSELQIMTPMSPSHWTIKDLMAHLRAWQQRTIARLEAARDNREPVFPKWGEGIDIEDHKNIDVVNAWIYEAHREDSWPTVYHNWRNGFLRVIELTEVIPEKDLLQPGRYAWMWNNEPLAVILQSSYEHHHIEHYEPLLEWLRAHGVTTPD